MRVKLVGNIDVTLDFYIEIEKAENEETVKCAFREIFGKIL